MVEMPVLGADQEVEDAVPVPVDDGGGGVVSGEDPGIEEPFVAKMEGPRITGDPAQEIHVLAVDQEVEVTVAIPVGQAKFAAAALSGPFGVEPEQAALTSRRHCGMVCVER